MAVNKNETPNLNPHIKRKWINDKLQCGDLKAKKKKTGMYMSKILHFLHTLLLHYSTYVHTTHGNVPILQIFAFKGMNQRGKFTIKINSRN